MYVDKEIKNENLKIKNNHSSLFPLHLSLSYHHVEMKNTHLLLKNNKLSKTKRKKHFFFFSVDVCIFCKRGQMKLN